MNQDSPSSSQIKPHPELWFEDGNIELIAEGTSFRVHKSVLAGSSDFFKDMFSLPQPPPEEPAGEVQSEQSEIPRLQTSETAQDLGHFLDVMYNSLKYFQKDSQITFTSLQAVLTLSQKFSSEELRTFAIGRLDAAFPRNFTEWEAISGGDRVQPVIYTDDELILIANMARESGLTDILPVVLYDCCQQDIDWILEGTVGEDGRRVELSSENRKSCLQARSKLTAATLQMLRTLAYARDGLCDQYGCIGALRDISGGELVKDRLLHHPLVVLDEEFASAPQPQPQGVALLNMVGAAPVTGIACLCRLCRDNCRNQMRIAREKLLRNLDEFISTDV
ncbi:hypothetical protein BC835DRAFT_1349557 [Cytidiella melzeri]|nr:hypothetical protein BC835DRAFT_1349557 [Cytidiella melzeri]